MRDRIGTKPLVVALAMLLVGGGLTGAFLMVADDTGGEPAEFRFANVSDAAGFEYASAKQLNGIGNGNEGTYVVDYNNDDWPDLLVTGGEQPALFENVGGEFRRTDALPAVDGYVQSAFVFDRDSDGWEDILLLPRNGRAAFFSNERGTFVQEDVGLDTRMGVAVGATAADYDGDGVLDLFVYQYGDWKNETPNGWNHHGGVASDNGARNVLYAGTGDGFRRVDSVISEGSRWTLAASFTDLTGDGRPDIHVANDFNYDYIYVNRGDGFELRELPAATNRNGMSSEVADVNGDGRPDLFVSNIYLPVSKENVSAEKYQLIKNYQSFILGKRTKGNTLLIAQENGSFVDRAAEYGVRRGGWAWAASLSDFDDDSDDDLITTTQTTIRIDDKDPTYTYPMVWQRGDTTFARTDASDAGFEETNGRGMATLDYDRDGDLDIVVANSDGRYVLYENRIDGGNSITVEVNGGDGTSTIGARVSVTVDGATQAERKNVRSDYQSQDSRLVHIGVDDATEVDSVRVRWPDGTEHVLRDVPAQNRIEVWKNGTSNRTPYPGS